MDKRIQALHDECFTISQSLRRISSDLEKIDTGAMSADKVHSLLAAMNEVGEASDNVNRAKLRLATIT